MLPLILSLTCYNEEQCQVHSQTVSDLSDCCFELGLSFVYKNTIITHQFHAWGLDVHPPTNVGHCRDVYLNITTWKKNNILLNKY